jgi:gliding motility-associated-like protein
MMPVLKQSVSVFVLLLAILLVSASHVHGQKQANKWYFGKNAAMDFNGGAPVPLLNSNMWQFEGCASIADPITGDLLFYTNGDTVWDATHTIMPNGSGLMGDWSSTQSAVIVPKPSSTNIYYIFTVSAQTNPDGLRYSEVDMSLNSGLGDVVFSSKNTALRTPMTEKICATAHANGQDIWVVSHGWNSDTFYAYLVTAAGVNLTPVRSGVGAMHSGGSSHSIGQMKISPQGDRLALATFIMSTIEVFDFNNSSGAVSNAISLPTTQWDYGLEFSPDGSKLYFGSWDVPNPSFIYQFDLSSGSSSTIVSSKTTLFTSGDPYGSFQLAPDDKIYIARQGLSTLSVIHDPNKAGLGCNYDDTGYAVGGTALSNGGLPNFVSSWFTFPKFEAREFCFNDTTWFDLSDTSGIDSVRWNFGDPASGALNSSTDNLPWHIYTDTGLFTTSVVLYEGLVQDTFSETFRILASPIVDLGPDTAWCTGSMNLNGGFNGTSWLWSTGDTTQFLNVQATGTYWVRAELNGCFARDTMIVDQLPPIDVDAGPDLISDCELVEIQATSTNGTAFIWTPASSLDDPTTLNPRALPKTDTWYFVTASGIAGCNATDSVFVEAAGVEGIEMPNAFSPNGDGHNDRFRPVHKCIDQGHFIILNRYGKVIFETNDLDVAWDGQFKGEPQPMGTYVYHLTGELVSGEKIDLKGNISLLR